MNKKIFISSNVFETSDLNEILELCIKYEFDNLELSANIDYCSNVEDVLQKDEYNHFQFLLHNYFPHPEKDFVLNLASNDDEVLKRSMDLCKKAINLSAVLNAPFYGVHAGFAFYAKPSDLGKSQVDLPRIPYDGAYNIFLSSMKILADYAEKKNVKLAVENNVVSKFNVIDGKNELLLLAEAEEMVRFYNDLGSENLYFLLDLGHLKVTSQSLELDVKSYLDKVLSRTLVFHLSDNNATEDQNMCFDNQVWFKDILRDNAAKIFVIEIKKSEIATIQGCYQSVRSMIEDK